MSRSVAACVVACVGAIASTDASAWSARAHRVVGDVAARLLSPAATAAVAELLADDRLAAGRPSGRSTLADVANWADELRDVDRSTGVYHFDDAPLCGRADKAAYCPDGRCGTAWFTRQLAVLADRSQPTRARNEALKWIVHLAGDLHQPLHASDDGDRGGNDVKVTFLGARGDPPTDGRAGVSYNLHMAWDRLIPYRLFDATGGDAAFAAALPSAATRAAWRAGAIDAWAAESYELAHDFVYPALSVERTCGAKIDGVVAIDARYDAMAEVVAGEQIRKAGVRLAKVLDDALSQGPAGGR